MKVACVGYRGWALRIYDDLARTTGHEFLIIRSRAEYDETVLRRFQPDLVLFYGWSWIVPPAVVSDLRCVMLHPSPLPKYRGGSPLQNQIIAGETESAVTLFLMDEGMDSGPILAQKSFSLAGKLDEIFERIVLISVELTRGILDNGLRPVPQDESEATVFPRRKPAESEITADEIREKSARYLYDKIRMLQPPYPPAFIRAGDGRRLLILDAQLEGDQS